MADHIRTIPQGVFDMEDYRKGQHIKPECDSVGCAVGHCPVLDPNPNEIPRLEDGCIDYMEWSMAFTGLNDAEWLWCFDPGWRETDNKPEGAALRIEWILNHGLPEDWYEQLQREAPLCYKVK